MSVKKDRTAVVQTKKVGRGTRIWQYAVVLEGARIGADCNLCAGTFVENDVTVGDRVTLKNGVYLWDGLRVGDDVFIGPNVTFTNDKRPRSRRKPAVFDRTVLKKGCSIGAGAVILGGVTIGEYAMVGAGAVVTKDVPANTLWYGHPAKFRSFICHCGEKASAKPCRTCGYKKTQ